MCVKYNLNDELIIRMPYLLYLFVQFPHSLINSGCSSVRIYAFLSKYYIYIIEEMNCSCPVMACLQHGIR